MISVVLQRLVVRFVGICYIPTLASKIAYSTIAIFHFKIDLYMQYALQIFVNGSVKFWFDTYQVLKKKNHIDNNLY